MKKEIIRNTLKVFAVGGSVLLMAASAGLLGYLSACLFFSIPNISGYLAVASFAVALIAAAGSLVVVYMCGAWAIRNGRFGKGKFER